MLPLSVPNLCGNEWKYIKECLDTNWVSSVGSFVNKFEQSIADFTGAKYAVATSNGTAALHISLLLAGVQQGDLVLVPNITFIASVNSIKYAGASPILIDIDEHTWQMNLDLLEQFLAKETLNKNGVCVHKKSNRIIRAIMPVHVLGNMCNMEKLSALAEKYKLTVIEDATESLGSYYKKKHAGTFGTLGCLSFNGNKIITTGGGGMLITNNEKLAKRAKHLTTQAKADAFEYFHDEVGYNYRLVNILAVMGVAQMELLPSFLKKKKEITFFYQEKLKDICGIKFQELEKEVVPNNWLFTASFPKQKKLMHYLLSKDIQVRPFWVPMNRLPMFKKEMYITTHDDSNKVYKNCMSLPCSTNIKGSELKQVVSSIKEFYQISNKCSVSIAIHKKGFLEEI